MSSHQANRDAPQQPHTGPDAIQPTLVVGTIPQEPIGFRPKATLESAAGSPVVRVVIGMPGAGKTQLAAGYARAGLAAGWRLVAWIDAEDAGTLASGLAEVADAAGLSEGAAARGSVDPGQRVRNWLETDGDRCLLVFDNANDAEALRPFLPAAGAAHVLITSEQPSMADLGTAVPVDVFTAGEARAFLAERTGLADDEAAAAVAAELGHLPLALAVAAAAITGLRLEYRTYLERLRAEYTPPDPVMPYPDGVAEAVLLCLEAAEANDRSGAFARITAIVAVLSAAGVQRPLLYAAGQAGALADGGRRMATGQVDRALEILAGWSLLTLGLDGQTVLMHPLVSRVVRDRLARRARLTAAGRAAALVLERHARALAGSLHRAAVRDITRQATALLGRVPQPEVGQRQELTGVLLRLRFLTLYHLIELADSARQAAAVGEPLTADLNRILGPDHPDTLNARNSLAAAYQAAGQTARAVPLFEQTLAARERILGPDHLSTLTSQGNLAAAYRDAGRAKDAIPPLEQALAGRERILGPDHPDTMSSRNNLAAAYRDAGRAKDAIPLLEQALAERQRIFGPGHPKTLAARNNLANTYRDVGRAAEAIPLHQQNLTMCERVLGTDHPRTQAARDNLAAACQAAGRAADAIPLLEQTVADRERALGADHPKTQAARASLGAAWRAAGRTG